MRRVRWVVAGVSVMVAACSGGVDDDGVTSSTPASAETVIEEPGDELFEATDVVAIGDQREPDPASALYDQSQVHTFDLVVDPDDLATLDADPAAEEYVDGFLDFGGERYGPIGVRYKGSFGAFVGCVEDLEAPGRPRGAKTCTKLSMKLKFDGRYDVDFFGVDKVQLHSQNLDPTMMHERLGYALFREFGVPAPRSTHARVTMNGDLLGLFALTEQIDARFLATVFDDPAGNLYKEAWPVVARPPESIDDYFLDRLRTNEDEPLPVDPIRDLGTVVTDTDGGQRLAAIDPLVDVDAWFRYLVVDRAIAHDDGPLRFDCPDDGCGNKNFYLYQEPSSGEISIIAWDLDAAFATLTNDPTRDDQLVLEIADEWNEISNDCVPFAHGPADLIQRSPACDPLIAAFAEDPDRYEELRDDFLAGPYSGESIDALLDAWSAQVEPVVAEAAAQHSDAILVENWRTEVDLLRADIAAERNR